MTATNSPNQNPADDAAGKLPAGAPASGFVKPPAVRAADPASGSAAVPPVASAVEPLAASQSEPPVASAVEPIILYRVRFRVEGERVADRGRQSSIPAGPVRPLMHFDGPQPTQAEVETLSAESFVKLAQAPPKDEELLLLFLSDRAPDQEQWRREAESWMDGEEGDGFGPALRVGVDNGWVLWRPGRAVVLAPPARGEELLAAVTDFSFHHAELRRLETELSANWAELQQDLPLAHKVGRKELRRQEHVGKMTALTLGWRLRAARTEQGLTAPWAGLSQGGRRVGEKLRSLARVEERLERLDGQIEVYEYDYELINQRLGEYQHFRKEMIAEIFIIAILAFDVILWVADFYLNHFGPESGQ